MKPDSECFEYIYLYVCVCAVITNVTSGAGNGLRTAECLIDDCLVPTTL